MAWTWIWVIIGIVVLVIAGALLVNRVSRRVRTFSQKLNHVLRSYQLTDDMLAQWAVEHLRKLDQEAYDLLNQAEALPGDAVVKLQGLRKRLAKIIKP